MNRTAPDDEGDLLRKALGAFLEHGFHAVTLGALESATGGTWAVLSERYGDKEGLFLAAAERGLVDGSIAALGKEAEILGMLNRLERVNGNPRLRAIHKQSLNNVRAIADNGSSRPS